MGSDVIDVVDRLVEKLVNIIDHFYPRTGRGRPPKAGFLIGNFGASDIDAEYKESAIDHLDQHIDAHVDILCVSDEFYFRVGHIISSRRLS